MGKPEYTTLASREVYKNRWMRLREDEIERASGQKGIYTVVEKPTFAIIIATDGEHVFMVEQYRYTTGERHLEFPQGANEDDHGISPIALAQQELREETGIQAESWTHVAYQWLAYGFCDQGYNVYVAKDLSFGEQALEPEEEGLVMKKIRLTELESMIAEGEITDATTCNAFGLARLKGLI